MSEYTLARRIGVLTVVAALFLVVAPPSVRAQAQGATHSGVFRIDSGRSIAIWENRPLSPGSQNVLVTVCVTTGQGVNVTVDGSPLFAVGLGSPPFNASCRTGNVQLTGTIDLNGAMGHVEGTYTVSTNLK